MGQIKDSKESKLEGAEDAQKREAKKKEGDKKKAETPKAIQVDLANAPILSAKYGEMTYLLLVKILEELKKLNAKADEESKEAK